MCDGICDFYPYVIGSFEMTGWYFITAGLLLIGFTIGRRT
jgi:hypothetical protein